MFWDKVACVYDLFVNVVNRDVHEQLKKMVKEEVSENDIVLECACGTGMLTEAIAKKCRKVIATDFSQKMLEKAGKNCRDLDNIEFSFGNILNIEYPNESFDVVVAGNVIHLLDEPLKALKEMERVCKAGGKIIIPTYMNKDKKGNNSTFVNTVNVAGADFKRQFTFESYQDFFEEAGYSNGIYHLIEGRIPCAIAVLRKKEDV